MENIQTQFKNINKKIMDGDYFDALCQCNIIFNDDFYADEIYNVLRMRSHIYNHQGDYEHALHDRLRIVNNSNPIIEDYYFAAIFASRTQQYKNAISIVNDGIIMSHDKNETQYFQELNFLKCFILVKLERFDQARFALEHFDENIKMWIDRPSKPYTKSELRMAIENEVKLM
jgi:tetratricopeptide (TPR) repeat protein